MANSLDMKVIAEGVETLDQVNSLIDLACDYGHGFLFNKPLDGDAAFNLLMESFS